MFMSAVRNTQPNMKQGRLKLRKEKDESSRAAANEEHLEITTRMLCVHATIKK